MLNLIIQIFSGLLAGWFMLPWILIMQPNANREQVYLFRLGFLLMCALIAMSGE